MSDAKRPRLMATTAARALREPAGSAMPLDPEQSRARLGLHVRTLRKQQGQTLQRLSERTGLAVSTLSKIENGRLSVSFDRLVILAQGLDVDLSALLAQENRSGPVGRRAVTRQGGGDRYETPQYTYELLCNDMANKRIIPLRAKIRSRSIEEFGPLTRHAGEEYVYVLEGAIRVYSEFYEPLRLGEGDSVYFDSTMGHALVCDREPGIVLWMCTLPPRALPGS